jgi:hypothetical protein
LEGESQPEPEVNLSLTSDDGPTVTAQFHVILDGKPAKNFETRNIVISEYSFDELKRLLREVMRSKSKLSYGELDDSETSASWIWLTVPKSQSKNLPRMNGLDNEEDFVAAQTAVERHYNRKGHVDNMVLLIRIEIETGNNGPAIDAFGEPSGTRRLVNISAASSNYRPPQNLNVRRLKGCLIQILLRLMKNCAIIYVVMILVIRKSRSVGRVNVSTNVFPSRGN